MRLLRYHQFQIQTVGWVGRWVGGWFSQKIMPLRGLSCKIKLARFSARLKLLDRPSGAISVKLGIK